MTAKATIVAAIKKRVADSNYGYASWRVGLTHEPSNRKAYWRDTEKKEVSWWTQWEADSLKDAQDIESHFINEKMMKGGTGGDLSERKTVYVYIF